MTWTFADWLLEQRRLQDAAVDIGAEGAVPRTFDSEEQRREMLRWNILAAVAELMEGLDETPWKPWARDDAPWNFDAFMSEMNDALKFIANAIMVAGGSEQLAITGDLMASDYRDKTRIVLERWTRGHQGRAERCAHCGRSFDDAKKYGAPCARDGSWCGVYGAQGRGIDSMCQGCGRPMDNLPNGHVLQSDNTCLILPMPSEVIVSE